MLCQDVERLIEQEGLSPLSEAARGHVSGCASCSTLIADFELLVATANEFPLEVEPPARVWVALRAQLEAERIIHEPKIVVASPRAPWWQGFGQLIRGRLLATAAVAVLVAAAGYLQISHKAKVQIAPTAEAAEPFAQTGATLDQEELNLGPMQTASVSSVSNADNSLRENLATLNAFIKECRKRLQEDPHDQLARDYLSAAYQQKAEILAAMMERGRSVN
jgi:hypothetical protein